MTRLLAATYEHGQIVPRIPLRLTEHQKLLVAIVIDDDDTPGILLAKAAEKSKSFEFLSDPKEDIYSPEDGNGL